MTNVQKLVWVSAVSLFAAAGMVGASIAGAQATPVAAVPLLQAPRLCFSFPHNLSMGQSNAEVVLLNYFLQQEGFPLANARSGEYDDLTAAAVKAFQEKYTADILVPAGLSAGNGRFGKLTRAKMNALYSCAPKSSVVSLISQNLLLNNDGVSATFCNKGDDVDAFPIRIRLNGINRDFDITGAHAQGTCATASWPYSTWGLSYDPGSLFTAVTLIDPFGIYKIKSLTFPA